MRINAEDCYTVDGLRDRSVKPGEALWGDMVPDLKRIARTKVDSSHKTTAPDFSFIFMG